MAESFYRATALRPEEAAAAFPLANMLHRDLTIGQWRRFVRNVTRPASRRAGVIAVRDRRSYIHALFVYRVEDDVAHRHVLRLTHLIMGRLPGGVLAQSIVAHAERLAASLGDLAIALDASIDGLTRADYQAIRRAGFATGGVVLTRAPQSPRRQLDADQSSALLNAAGSPHASGGEI